MIAVSPALHLLVAVSMAAPATDPSACAADDLHCSARAFTSAARRATSDAERVEYLYFASRAYLALSEKPPQSPASSRDLCQAKQLIEKAVALPATELRDRVTKTRQETRTRLTRDNIQCHQPTPRAKDDRRLVDAPAVAASATSPKPPPVDSPAHPAEPTREPPPLLTSDATSEPPAPEPRSAVDPPSVNGPRSDETLMRIPARRKPARPETDGPRPGRRLVIAGGVLLGAGVALTAGAGHMGRRMNETRQEYFTFVDSVSGFATPEQDAKASGLLGDYNGMRTQALVLAVAGGATIVVAAVLAGVGGRRMPVPRRGPRSSPPPGGLRFTLDSDHLGGPP